MSTAPSPYLAFISLARFDQQIHEKTIKIGHLLHEIDEATQEIEVAQKRVSEAKLASQNMRKSIDEKELELKILKERERDIKRKLDVVASVKEYTSLQHEHEELTQAQDVLENTVLSLLQNYDELVVALQQAESSAADIQRNSDIRITEKKLQRAQLQEEISNIQEERVRIKPLVQPEVLQQYEIMREKVPNPAVSVKENACSSCFYAITVADMAAIRRHKMVMCKDCYRFLYEAI